MPIVGDAKKVHDSMVETYGKEKGERVFYATANKQKRKAENWKKKSAAEKLAVILDEIPDDGVPGGLADGKPDSVFPKDQLEKGVRVEQHEHGGPLAVSKDLAKDHEVEDKEYYDHLEKMEELGSRIMKAAALVLKEQPSVAPGVAGPKKLVDASTGQPPAAPQGAPQAGKPTAQPAAVPAAGAPPPGQPTVPGAPPTLPPPPAMVKTQAEIIKTGFAGLRLRGILQEV